MRALPLSRAVFVVLLTALLAGGASAQGAPVVLPGYDPAAVAKAAAVFRNFGGSGSDTGHEVFLGGPVGSGEQSPVGAKFDLPGTWPSSSHVTFGYDGSKIWASAQGTAGTGEFAYAVGNLGAINYLRISVVVLAGDAAVALSSVTLGPWSLGDFPGVSGVFRNWHVKGVDLSAGFTVEGDITLSGAQPMGGDNRVVIEAGYLGNAFDGFYEPITMGVTNVARAGRAIPVKWRLTDAGGAPVSDPASFVGLYSDAVDCGDATSEPTGLVTEEIAAGASGLQYNGDGYWQYNWKTPESYASTCRLMYVGFAGGVTSPAVRFQFK